VFEVQVTIVLKNSNDCQTYDVYDERHVYVLVVKKKPLNIYKNVSQLDRIVNFSVNQDFPQFYIPTLNKK